MNREQAIQTLLDIALEEVRRLRINTAYSVPGSSITESWYREANTLQRRVEECDAVLLSSRGLVRRFAATLWHHAAVERVAHYYGTAPNAMRATSKKLQKLADKLGEPELGEKKGPHTLEEDGK